MLISVNSNVKMCIL